MAEMTDAACIAIAVTSVLVFLSLISIALRVYCFVKVMKSPLRADTWLIIVAMLLYLGGVAAVDYGAVVTGVGDLNYIPTSDDLVLALKIIFVCQNLQVATMGIIKVSILLYYKRVFSTYTFVRYSNRLIGLVTAFTLSVVLVMTFSKWPIQTQWDPTVPYNINMGAVLIVFCVTNAFFDMLTLSLPLLAIWRLKMANSKKVTLSVIFTVGSFCVISSLVRLSYAVKWTKIEPTPASLFQYPCTYNILWGMIEPPSFIIAGCLLTLGPLIRDRSKPNSRSRSPSTYLFPGDTKPATTEPCQSKHECSTDNRKSWNSSIDLMEYGRLDKIPQVHNKSIL